MNPAERAGAKLTERVKTAVGAELEQHRDEIESHAAETSEIRLTVKFRNGNVWRVLFSRTTERDFKNN
jgi:hypothetical protein